MLQKGFLKTQETVKTSPLAKVLLITGILLSIASFGYLFFSVTETENSDGSLLFTKLTVIGLLVGVAMIGTSHWISFFANKSQKKY
jgi:hypothetical protein